MPRSLASPVVAAALMLAPTAAYADATGAMPPHILVRNIDDWIVSHKGK